MVVPLCGCFWRKLLTRWLDTMHASKPINQPAADSQSIFLTFASPRILPLYRRFEIEYRSVKHGEVGEMSSPVKQIGSPWPTPERSLHKRTGLAKRHRSIIAPKILASRQGLNPRIRARSCISLGGKMKAQPPWVALDGIHTPTPVFQGQISTKLEGGIELFMAW